MSDLPRLPRPGQDPPAARLRLVHPTPPPKPKTKERRREVRVFSPEEQGRLRAALKGAARAFGSRACLADVLRVSLDTVKAAGRHGVSPALAVRLSKALGVPVENLYRAPTDAATCPHCGARRAS